MPLNEMRVLSIILEECKKVPERYEGYHDDLLECLADIVSYERQHMVSGTNIQQKVNDKCNATGRLLTEKRPGASVEGA